MRWRRGRYEFEGWIKGVGLKATIKPKRTGYGLWVKGEVNDANWQTTDTESSTFNLGNPVTVTVWIGANGGTASVKADFV